MRHLQHILAVLLLLATSVASAQNYTKITYVHSDADGTPFAATDQQGNIEWRIDHYPYGDEYSNTQVARKSDISFAGKPFDEEIGLSYFGGRWYDPAIGRFTGIDPMPVDPNDYRSFNRYSYGFNNPYKYVDPDGNLPILIAIPWVVGVISAAATGYDIGSTGYDLYSGRLSGSDLAGDVGKGLAIDAGLKAIPGGAAISIAKKLNADTFLTKGTDVFRVHGPENKGADGYFWTTKNPRLSNNYRNDAGLPNQNSADTLIEGKIKKGTFAGGGKAKPLDGNKGGWPESRISNAEAKVSVKKTSKLD